jgi:ATP-dependent Clp protease protease subunit
VITGEYAFHDFLLAMDSPGVNPNHDPIKMIITSPGGDLDSAFLLIDTMKHLLSPVITIGRYCASAACLILASGKERYLYPHAKTMLHLATGQMGGDAKDWEIQHKQMMIYKNKIIDILTDSGVKRKRDDILRDIDRDFWMDSEETINYGLADEIMTSEKWSEFIGD